MSDWKTIDLTQDVDPDWGECNSIEIGRGGYDADRMVLINGVSRRLSGQTDVALLATPDEARALAAELNRLADEIEAEAAQ